MSELPPIPASLVETLRRATRVAVLTGAGVSAESGVPTFRDALTGLWARFRPEELATPEAFRRNPRLVWEWYASRRAALQAVAPNPAHLALAELERRVPGFCLATQNVDGLHQRAGSRKVLELHGNITRIKCSAEDRVVDAVPATDDPPPRCPQCGGLLRPDVVWFGESLPPDALENARAAAEGCEVFLAIGTAAVVYPAAGLIDTALLSGACVVEINPQRTAYTDRVTYSLSGAAGRVLPILVRAAWPRPLASE